MKTRIGIRIDDRRFKPDMDLLDRYVAYSAELLRLALLGMAGYGFLLKEAFSASGAGALSASLHKTRWSLIVGIISLGISAAIALQHRIYATDVVACIIANLRYRVQKNQPKANEEAQELRLKLKLSALFLPLSALFLWLGAAAIAFTFARVLWTASL